ncbi:hypothetical protein FKP32DRAFT_1759747 [Trametes sanguinea]|nr:hypothetical protein FKP32DRAFT_1759747 [Trametes sanguinea]
MGGRRHLDVSLAIQELVRSQVDRLLSQTCQRTWTEWQHEDLRQASLVCRKELSWSLLDRCPGLLSGLGAVSLADDSSWLPVYVLRADIPRDRLLESPYSSDFYICNVVWEHLASGTLAVTLFNNHLDPLAHASRDFMREASSTVGDCSLHSSFGRNAAKFSRTFRTLMDRLGPVDQDGVASCVAFRVGHIVGQYNWSRGEHHDRQIVLSQLDLTPLSLQGAHEQHGTTGPHNEDTPGLSREHEKDVSIIYRERFNLRLSEKIISDARATEPCHERSLVTPDEMLFTVIGLEQSCAPECIFGGVWDMFPPGEQWAIPGRCRDLPSIVFYKPREGDPSFYTRGYRVPYGPPLNRLGIHYLGDLVLSADGQRIVTTGTLFEAYLCQLCAALDDAFRGVSDLAMELALDILTEQRTLPYSFGMILASPLDIDEEGALGYRRGFEAAWRILDSSLSETSVPLYPYTARSPAEEMELISKLGYRPVLVQGHVRQLLESSKAYPAITVLAQQRLLSAPGAEEPPGTDRLVAALAMLLPDLSGDILSVRRYEHSYPLVLWDPETRTFVMSSSVACAGHASEDLAEPCCCWVGLALFDALASWRSQATGHDGAAQGSITDAAAYHALLQCTASKTASLRHSNSSHSSCSAGTKEKDAARSVDEDGDEELEYIDRVAPTPASSVIVRPPVSSTGAAPLVAPCADLPGSRFITPPNSKLPLNPPRSYPSRSRRRSEVFVITPLLPSVNDSGQGTSSRGLALAEANDAASALDSTPQGASAAPHAPSIWSSSNAGARNIADMSDIMHDAQERVDARVQAMAAYYSREAGALQDQLARAQRRASELETSLEGVRAEHAAALAAVREEHSEVLGAKEEALQARERALESKDDMLRRRDVGIARLREGLRAQTRRAVRLQGEVRRLSVRERRQSERLQAEMEGLLSRLSQIAQGSGEQGAAEGDEITASMGERDAEGGERDAYGDGERTLKRVRTH